MSPGIRLCLLLHKHHQRGVGTARGTRCGLALGPGLPAPHGQDVMEGGRRSLGQTVPPCPYSRVSVSDGFASAQAHRGIAFPDMGRFRQVGLVWACKAFRGIGPILFRFCHITLLQHSRARSTGGPSKCEGTAASMVFMENSLWWKPWSPCWSQMTQLFCFLGQNAKLL